MTVASAMMTNLKALRTSRTTRGLPLPIMEHNAFAELLDFAAIQDVQMRLLPEAPKFAETVTRAAE
jgi:hypothetical protein